MKLTKAQQDLINALSAGRGMVSRSMNNTLGALQRRQLVHTVRTESGVRYVLTEAGSALVTASK
jgi:hypothetical protein